MTQPAPTPCVVFDVDGTLAEFDADRLGHLVHGVEKHWDEFHHAMADAALIAPIAANIVSLTLSLTVILRLNLSLLIIFHVDASCFVTYSGLYIIPVTPHIYPAAYLLQGSPLIVLLSKVCFINGETPFA